jgi:DNA-binding protein H-NS
MTALQTFAKSKSAVNREAKALSVAEIEKVIAHLNDALIAAKKREESKDSRKRQAELKKLQDLMTKLGVSAEEVAGLANTKRRGRKPAGVNATPAVKTGKRGRPAKNPKAAPKRTVPAKYALVEGNEKILWTGRGRMPVRIKAYLDAGNSLDSILIK